MARNPQRRHWCWTLWLTDDASPEEAEAIAKQIHSYRGIRYSVCQAERSEDLMRIHLQGYTEFSRSFRMSEVKKHLKQPTLHLEIREGGRGDARNYCMSKTWKGNSKRRAAGPFETGAWISDVAGSVKPRKSHTDTALKCLLSGMFPHQIAAAHPSAFFTHSHKILQTWQALNDAVKAGIFDYVVTDEEE